MNAAARWFKSRGWTPFPFQRAVWDAYRRGESGLVHAATGTGKTFAAWLGPVMEALDAPPAKPAPLTVLWITPLRALARDLATSLTASVDELGLRWTVGVRTGDTSSADRARQRKTLPSALITTPESLTLLLTYADAAARFGHVKMIVVDEWHELMGSKRGTQMELALARLRTLCPSARVWGLSATLGNTAEAMGVLLGGRPGRLVAGHAGKAVDLKPVLPTLTHRFPWAGHLGLALIDPVLAAIERARSTLVFTNTRSQAELWYQAIVEKRPDWAGVTRLHHGSLDRAERDAVEEGLRTGALRCVVATSSLDLGVDFSPVDQVVQVGSPKGVARLVQRAGRSGHRPGATSSLLCVPTHAFELVEVAAARAAVDAGRVESRAPLRRPLDVLAQHLVTAALGGGFEETALRAEVQSTWAYRDLSDAEWDWALRFVTTGGVLHAYPEYRRVVEADGRFTVENAGVAARHRQSVGTITSDGAVEVRLQRGKRLGTVEESFLSKLRRGDVFIFAGRRLEFLRVLDMRAHVRLANRPPTAVPRWLGGKMPLSSELADGVHAQLDAARRGRYDSDELRAVRPILELQRRLSRLPAADEVVVEIVSDREGRHLFVYPFAGRLANEGIAALAAWRLSRRRPATFSISVNDYGFELLTRAEVEVTEEDLRAALSPDRLLEDVAACLNATEMARRQFREIARVSGLVFQGQPWKSKSTRQIQASSGLVFDVLRRHDPANLLLAQADREVLERQLDVSRLMGALRRIAGQTLAVARPERITPLGFPVWAERAQQQVTSESWRARVERMALDLDRAADRVPAGAHR